MKSITLLRGLVKQIITPLLWVVIGLSAFMIVFLIVLIGIILDWVDEPKLK